MKEAIVSNGPKVEIRDVPIPQPNPDQVLIKVIVSGSNPKDWKVPGSIGPHNSGDDISGIVESVGEDVIEFKPGDRVAAFHEITKPGGSFAEYAIAWAHTAFHLPQNTSFEEGACIPLAAMTSALALYHELGLSPPWKPATLKIPLVIYGASSALGAYAIKLAQASNIHPLICIAGRAQSFVEGLIDKTKGDAIIDYRNGNEAVTAGIKEALAKAGFTEAKYAFDAVSEKHSYQNIIPALAKTGSRITVVLPGKDYSDIPDNIERSRTSVSTVHQGPTEEQVAAGIKTSGREFGYVFYKLFSRGLKEGWFSAHSHEVVTGGLNGIEKGLTNYRDGINSGVKYVFKMADTA